MLLVRHRGLWWCNVCDEILFYRLKVNEWLWVVKMIVTNLTRFYFILRRFVSFCSLPQTNLNILTKNHWDHLKCRRISWRVVVVARMRTDEQQARTLTHVRALKKRCLSILLTSSMDITFSVCIYCLYLFQWLIII